MVFSNRGSRRRGQAPALRRRHVCHNHRSNSAAWHRWRPGGPSRYSAAAVRAYGVIPMRAAQGAAAPVTQVNTGPPPKPSEAGSVGRGGTVEGVSFAACGEANDLELVPTKRASMRGWSLPCPYNPPPPRAPVWGSRGQSPRPFFSPISLGRNGGAPGRRATTGRPYECGRMISAPTGRAVDIPCRADPSPGGPGK